MTRSQANLLLVICTALWGIGFLFQKSAMAHIGPMTLVAARTGLAALLLLPLALIEHKRATTPLGREFIALAVLAGVAFTGGALLQQFGIVTASVTNTGFLTALYVVVTPFLSFAITRRAVSLRIWVAAALSFVGTWLLGAGTLGGFGFGDFLVAASAILWALHLVVVGVAAPRGYPILLTTLQFAVVGVLATAGALIWETVSIEQLRAATPAILYVGGISTALTFTVLTLALRSAEPAEAAIVLSLETLFAAFFAWIFFDERMTALGVLGACGILAGVIIVNYRATGQRLAAASGSEIG